MAGGQRLKLQISRYGMNFVPERVGIPQNSRNAQKMQNTQKIRGLGVIKQAI
jgi:hypothetical protein